MYIVGTTTVIDQNAKLVVNRLTNSTISANTNADPGTHYIANTKLVLSLPSSPTVGDTIGFSNQSGAPGCVIAANTKNINGLAEDLNVDRTWVAFRLQYSANTSQGWVFL